MSVNESVNGSGKLARLASRGVLKVSGPDAASYLQGIVTTDIEDIEPDGAHAGALLTPQGKIIADFLISKVEDGFLLDLAASRLEEIKKRLTLYKLRAQVTIEDVSAELPVHAAWGQPPSPASTTRPTTPILAKDMRLDVAGWRLYGVVADPLDESAYTAHRIALGLVEGGADYPFNDAVPHEAGMDAIGGVDFKKGCYVGQEVVSRMKHRGTARRRPVLVSSAGALPASGTEITANGREVGVLGASADGRAVAIARLDRVKEAVDAGVPLLAGDVPVTLSLPAHATWEWPEGASPEG